MYDNYISLNVQYTSGHKKYNAVQGVEDYCHNRPRSIVHDFGRSKGLVEQRMKESVINISPGIFSVESGSETSDLRVRYTVDLGTEDRFCSCECRAYRKSRTICKHFFAIFATSKAKFEDLTPLYRNHVLMTLDEELINAGLTISEESGAVITDDLLDDNSENKPLSSMSFNNREAAVDATLPKLPLRRPKLKDKQINLRAALKNMIDMTYVCQDEDILEEIGIGVNEMITKMKKPITDEGLLNRNSPKKKKSNSLKRTRNKRKHSLLTSMMQKGKHKYFHRVGQKAEMMKHYYQARVKLVTIEEEKESEEIIINVPEDIQEQISSTAPGSSNNDVEIISIMQPKRPRMQKRRNNCKFNKDIEDQLTSNRRLNDESINLAHYIIHRQFPDVNGLEDTNLGDKDMYSVYIKKQVRDCSF